MEYSFPHYLLSKQSVDDRALNRTVLDALIDRLPPTISTSLKPARASAACWCACCAGTSCPARWITPCWTKCPRILPTPALAPDLGAQNGYQAETINGTDLRLSASTSILQIHFVQADVFDFIQSHSPTVDLLIAHALLDLLPLPGACPGFFRWSSRADWPG